MCCTPWRGHQIRHYQWILLWHRVTHFPPTPCIASFHLSNVKHDIPIWWLIHLNIFFSSFNLFVGKTVFYISVFWYQLLEIQTMFQKLSWVSLEILLGCLPRRKHLDNLPDHEKHKIVKCTITVVTITIIILLKLKLKFVAWHKMRSKLFQQEKKLFHEYIFFIGKQCHNYENISLLSIGIYYC